MTTDPASAGDAGPMAGRRNRPASTALRNLEAIVDAGERTTIGALLAGLGKAGLPLALVLLALPSVLPIPILPTGPVTGTLIALLAVDFGLGARQVRLPGFLLRLAAPRRALASVFRRAVPLVASLENRLRPGRLRSLTGAAARPPLAVLIFLLGVTVVMPVPFGNPPPGAALILLGLGLLARDGLAVLAGIVVGVFAIAWVAAVSAGTFYALRATLAAFGWW